MMNNKKKSIIIVALVALALIAVALFPSVAFAAEETTPQTRILRARGLAFERIENETVKMPTNLTLVVEPGKIGRGVITFNVVSGEMEVNGVKYTITEGKGLVAYYRRTLGMQLNGTDQDGNAVTVKLGGSYFWMWGRLHVARLAGTLVTDNAKFGLLLRAAIRPEQ